MSFSSDHIGFVLTAYAISAAVIILLIISHIVRARRNDRRLGELEGQDILRRRKPEEADQ